MRIAHLVKVVFDRRRIDINQAWLNRRYQFFRDYTLKSLLAQTFKDWRLWVCCQAGMQGMIRELRDVVPGGTLFTFAMDDPIPLDTISDETTRNWLQGSDYVYATRIDSDDLYSSDALQLANLIVPRTRGATEASLFRRGYLYDLNSKRLAVYANPSSPFHTLMVPTNVFLDKEKYRKLNYGDHSRVMIDFPCHGLPDWKFTVLIHGNNFLSTMNYSKEAAEYVEKDWSIDRFIRQPVVFDVDDLSDQWNCLDELDELKKTYPRFKATAFAIPNKCSPMLIKEAVARKEWLSLAVHGMNHEPNEELKALNHHQLTTFLKGLDYSIWTKGFRPPGWLLTFDGIRACNDNGLWVALHVRDRREYARHCKYGYYACEERLPCWHAHSHDTCGNWIRKDLSVLKRLWQQEQAFAWIDEVVCIPQQA